MSCTYVGQYLTSCSPGIQYCYHGDWTTQACTQKFNWKLWIYNKLCCDSTMVNIEVIYVSALGNRSIVRDYEFYDI